MNKPLKAVFILFVVVGIIFLAGILMLSQRLVNQR